MSPDFFKTLLTLIYFGNMSTIIIPCEKQEKETIKSNSVVYVALR